MEYRDFVVGSMVARHKRTVPQSFHDDLESAAHLALWQAALVYDPRISPNARSWLCWRVNMRLIDAKRRGLGDFRRGEENHRASLTWSLQTQDRDDDHSKNLQPSVLCQHESGYEEVESKVALKQVLSGMSERQLSTEGARRMFRYYLGDVTQSAMAEESGVTPSGVCQTIHTALRQARKVAEA